MILRVDPRNPDPSSIARAAEALRRGELVVMPTETVYGLAADPRVPGAEAKIFAAKGRPEDKAIARLASHVDQIQSAGADISGAALKLAKRFWPGPLTLVLRTGNEWTGYRIPAHEVALELLRNMRTVLAVTSANRSGEPPAIDASEAARSLGSSVALVLDAGSSAGTVPSTVVRVDGSGAEILREGAIPRKIIEDVLGK